ncbi:MAG: hypothetical protein KBT75_08080 [Oleispira antarctica]|nr:hypothetical protein [Oleispira antarctica]MBQ0791829.1 hypothetical protein [Oleispira antarctica]|tara:strand:- start:2016 stop:3041 length:1026 start_codon:yes stop_codon:yes gene_type:complete
MKTSKVSKPAKDYIAMWFDVRKELGISDAMNIGPMNKANGNTQWHTFSHSKMDGIGGIATILREQGYPCQRLPQSGEKSEPSAWKLYKLSKSERKKKKSNNTYTPYKSIRWKNNFSCGNDNTAEIVNAYFDNESTLQIKKNAKKNRVAFSTFLMWALNKAIADNLIEGNQNYYWFYPVNLRGAISLGSDTSNYSSGINICLNNYITPKQLQQEIKDKIKLKEHWSTWKLAHIGKLVGKPGIRYIYNSISKKNFYAGSFSYLGAWPLQGEKNPTENKSEVWVSCGIGTKNYPVSTGIMEWHGQLTLGLKLHPMICQDVALTQKCLSDWKYNLLEDKNHNEFI